MAEAFKCDVVNCGEFSEGSPVGRFITGSQARGMCQRHSDMLIDSYFPDLKPAPVQEEVAEAQPEAPATEPAAPAESEVPAAE